MPFTDLIYRAASPAPPLARFVESFWLLVNPSLTAQPIVLVTDGFLKNF